MLFATLKTWKAIIDEPRGY